MPFAVLPPQSMPYATCGAAPTVAVPTAADFSTLQLVAVPPAATAAGFSSLLAMSGSPATPPAADFPALGLATSSTALVPPAGPPPLRDANYDTEGDRQHTSPLPAGPPPAASVRLPRDTRSDTEDDQSPLGANILLGPALSLGRALLAPWGPRRSLERPVCPTLISGVGSERAAARSMPGRGGGWVERRGVGREVGCAVGEGGEGESGSGLLVLGQARAVPGTPNPGRNSIFPGKPLLSICQHGTVAVEGAGGRRELRCGME